MISSKNGDTFTVTNLKQKNGKHEQLAPSKTKLTTQQTFYRKIQNFNFVGKHNGVEYYSYTPAFSCKIGLPELYSFDGQQAKAVGDMEIMKVLRLLKNVDEFGELKE